jgi:SAM-dependent methyltransferase
MSRRHGLKARLHAWWEGYELAHYAGSEPDFDDDDEPLTLDQPAPEGMEDPGSQEAQLWNLRRIQAAELIWGHDALGPGGTEYTVHLAKPLGLSPNTNLLLVGGELGGGARAIATTYGSWVTSLEPDPDLVAEGAKRSKEDNLERKAVVRLFDPTDIDLRPRSFDGIFSREFLHSVPNKHALIGKLIAGLKDHGQLILTDLVLRHRNVNNPIVDDFCRSGPVKSDPWPLERLRETLMGYDLDVRIEEDITDVYKGHVQTAWARLARELEAEMIPRNMISLVAQECDRWSKRMRALETGDLAVFRFVATR